jgi:hypothetical protein
MSEKVGLIYVARGGDDFLGDGLFMPEMGREVSEELAALVDEETKRIIDECYQTALQTLTREKHRLIALAETLLKKESLDEKEILEVTGLADRPDLLAPADRTDTAPAEAPSANGRVAEQAPAPREQSREQPAGERPPAQPA